MQIFFFLLLACIIAPPLGIGLTLLLILGTLLNSFLEPHCKSVKSTPKTQAELNRIFVTPVEIHNGNKYMSAEDKATYMQSNKWLALKYQRLSIANNGCETCGLTTSLQLHHITYTNLGDENINDLRIQCNTCHSNLHIKLGYDRNTLYPIN